MILGLVCARAGSSFKDKNLLELGGRSLIEIALGKLGDFDGFGSSYSRVVSTDIPAAALPEMRQGHGLPYRARPAHLCGPNVSKWAVWNDAVEYFGRGRVTAIVDIDVTRPLTTAEDVAATIASHQAQNDAPVTLAVCRGTRHPEFDIYRTDERWGLVPWSGIGNVHARQELSDVYNYGGICVIDREVLDRQSSWFSGSVNYHEIPRERCFDIDDELDWEIVQDQWRRQYRMSPAPVYAAATRTLYPSGGCAA